MASTIQDSLLDEFQSVSSGAGSEVASALQETAAQIGELAASTANGSSGTAMSSNSLLSTILGSGLGVTSLASGLLGLFGGSDDSATTTTEKYSLPDKIYFEGATTGDSMNAADYDQYGAPRVAGSASAGTPADSSGSTAAQITVNVQAMDSQSFLDHSSEIAQAVREAMLNLSSLNDVVNDL